MLSVTPGNREIEEYCLHNILVNPVDSLYLKLFNDPEDKTKEDLKPSWGYAEVRRGIPIPSLVALLFSISYANC